MKYIITAKNIHDDPYTTDPCKRTELATELISTRMKALVMLDAGIVSKSDTIVTRIDRKCLYDQIFDNVIDWDEFVIFLREDYALIDSTIDLVKDICDGSIDTAKNFNNEFPVIPESIFNISLDCDRKLYTRPFICVLIRSNKNDSQKNLSENYWGEFILHFKEKNPGTDVFTFGDKLSLNISGVMHVENLRGWCALLSNENCKVVLSSCSGGVYPIFFVGHKNSNLIIVDNLKLTLKHSDSPSFYHDCINFKNVRVGAVYSIKDPSSLIEQLKDYAGI
jgi:hypothetical protein